MSRSRRRIPKLAYLEPVWVRWRDAREDPREAGSRSNPEARNGVGGLCEAWDQGFYVRHNSEHLVIARTLYTDGDFSGTLTIPRAWLDDVVPNPCPFEPEST